LPLPRRLAWLCYATAIHGRFYFVAYAIILVGGFVSPRWGETNTPTSNTMPRLPHRNNAARFILLGLSVESFFATLEVATISAPLTATSTAHGLLLTRQLLPVNGLSNSPRC